jgi:hypothetical protein
VARKYKELWQTAVGGVLIFGRQGLIIDRRQNRVVQWQ